MSGKEWTCWHATRRGPGHVADDVRNQDAVAVRTWAGGFLGVVADGVGRAPLSHVGSHMLCRIAVRELLAAAKLGVGDLSERKLRSLHRQWAQALQREGRELDAYATTCLLVYCNGGRITLARLGDGGAFVLRRDGGVETLDSDDDQPFSNITACMKADCPAWKLDRYATEDILALYVMTDGVYDDIRDRATFARRLHQAYQGRPAKFVRRNFLQALKAWPAPGHTDDMTLAGFQHNIPA